MSKFLKLSVIATENCGHCVPSAYCSLKFDCITFVLTKIKIKTAYRKKLCLLNVVPATNRSTVQ